MSLKIGKETGYLRESLTKVVFSIVEKSMSLLISSFLFLDRGL